MISLLAEALFAGAALALPKAQMLYALIVCAAILIITIVAIVTIEILDSRSARPAVPEIRPSRLTPDTAFLKQLVRGALEAVCRAVSIPETPESAKLRVFIFEKKENRLVCSHYWAQNPVEELVGKLEFKINSEVAKDVAVVQAVIDDKIARTKVKPLPADLECGTSGISDELTFVLAAPIHNQDGSIWGTVDFDAGNDIGKKLLSTAVSDAAMFQLSQHLQLMLSLDVPAVRTTA